MRKTLAVSSVQDTCCLEVETEGLRVLRVAPGRTSGLRIGSVAADVQEEVQGAACSELES